jgi:hypothetical protein
LIHPRSDFVACLGILKAKCWTRGGLFEIMGRF